VNVELLSKLKLRPIEFEKIDKHGKIGDEQVLVPGRNYVCLIDGRFSMGTFSAIWFGLNFFNGMMSHQFDPYRTNCTGFQAIWQVEGDEEISAALEMPYAEWQKEYCVGHKLTRGGRPITADAPIESFNYHHNRSSSCEDNSDNDDIDDDE